MTSSKQTTLHMIGNAHLDPVWLWQWPEGFQEAKATFRSALDRLNESPGFIFTSSSAAIYAWVEENDPALFAEISSRIAEGRWLLCGGWWIQPDCNIPGGESFVRQALYGQNYFRSRFGVTATVGYNVDSFGHHGMLPQILTKSGCDTYVFMRPEPKEMDLPGRIFWWESDDGSRVLTFRIPYAYTAGGTTEDLERQVLNNAAEATGAFPEVMCFYGVGNHGGGPTKENLRAIDAWDRDPAFPHLIYSSPRAFFDRALAAGVDWPVVHDDLQHHASGCYAAHSGVKRWNRQAENLLIAAEKWSAIAAQLLQRPYPADLTGAWKEVLFNQFHDILAGTSLEEAYDDARDTYGEAIAIARRRLVHAIHALAWQIDIPERAGTTPIVVFNSHAWPVTTCVELEFGGFPNEGGVLTDETGTPVPVQLVQSHATVTHWRNRLCFTAELPPMGYRVYHVNKQAESAVASSSGLTGDGTTIENELIRLHIDRHTGFIASLYDKRIGLELVQSGAARPVAIDDPSDTWSHGVLRFDREIASFRATAVHLTETGPVRATIRVESAYEQSTLVQDFTLYAGSAQIEVRVTVDWRQHFTALKLLFPLNLEETSTTYEIPYGVRVRPENGEEEPGQAWIDMTGRIPGSPDRAGLSLLNDGKYSFHSVPGTLGLTVLRSPIYAHHDPFVPDPDGHYSFIDQGIQRFTYALVPHPGDWRDGEAVRRAAELNQPAVPMIETYHAGPLPQAASFAAIDQSNVVISAFKRAEDNDDLIVRCYETAGRATEATLTLGGWQREVALSFTPYEIKTVRVPADNAQAVRETDLIESP